jgi:hypothetical protein
MRSSRHLIFPRRYLRTDSAVSGAWNIVIAIRRFYIFTCRDRYRPLTGGAQAHPVLPALQIFRQRLSYRSGLLDQRLWIQLSVATKRNWAYIRVAGKCVVMTAGPQGHVVVPAPLLPRRYLRTDSAASVPAPLHFFDIKNAVDELSQDRGAPVQPGKIAR